MEWISIYARPLKIAIEKNEEFLKTIQGAYLRESVKKYLETWAEIDRITSELDRSRKTMSTMGFAVSYLWFPALFSLVHEVFSSDVEGAMRTLRFVLEVLEVGLIGDCYPEFQNLSLEEKIKKLEESRDLLRYLDPLIKDKSLKKELKAFYQFLSRFVHAPAFVKKVVEDATKFGDVPSRVLYFGDFSEIEGEVIKELAKAIEKLCDFAKRLIDIWKECILYSDIS